MENNIETFEDLIEFIEINNLSIDQISKLTKETIDLHIMFYSDKNELMTDLKDYWKQWSHTTERPLFLGADHPFDMKKFWTSRIK
jgi:hypothetical protein